MHKQELEDAREFKRATNEVCLCCLLLGFYLPPLSTFVCVAHNKPNQTTRGVPHTYIHTQHLSTAVWCTYVPHVWVVILVHTRNSTIIGTT